MKQQKIYMKAWLDAHGRAKAVDTDEWYLDFANQLLPLVADSFIYGGREWEEDQKRVALTCALYLEDCVADGGNWRQFIHWHRKSYRSEKLRTLFAFLRTDGGIFAGRN